MTLPTKSEPSTFFNGQEMDEEGRGGEEGTSDPLSGRLLSEFRVLKVLGRGGFGEVIKVLNRLDDQVS